MRFTFILNLIQGRRDVPHLLGRVNICVSVKYLEIFYIHFSRSYFSNACVFENVNVNNFDTSSCRHDRSISNLFYICMPINSIITIQL